MSAKILHRAASLMRERAEAATSIYSEPHPKAGQAVEWFGPADMYDFDDHDGPHIASWRPAVALAVADSIEDVRCRLHCDSDGMRSPYCSRCEDSGDDHECPGRVPCTHSADFLLAVAVARAYLGES